ncbi:hypothetical protein FB45DRAFT_930342, partial [Roridomyces roridus]
LIKSTGRVPLLLCLIFAHHAAAPSPFLRNPRLITRALTNSSLRCLSKFRQVPVSLVRASVSCSTRRKMSGIDHSTRSSLFGSHLPTHRHDETRGRDAGRVY